MPQRTLVVSAFPPEQEFLLEMAREFPKTPFDFILCGIGPTRAAIGVTAAIALSKERPSRIVFCGTAGTFSSEVRIGSAQRVRRVRATDGAAAMGLSYYPAQKQPWEELESPLRDLPTSVCVCPPSITRETALAQRLATMGSLENLELWGVAQAAQTAGVPWEAFLGVSNLVGPDGHDQWKLNHHTASRAAGLMLWQCLAKG